MVYCTETNAMGCMVKEVSSYQRKLSDHISENIRIIKDTYGCNGHKDCIEGAYLDLAFAYASQMGILSMIDLNGHLEAISKNNLSDEELKTELKSIDRIFGL